MNIDGKELRCDGCLFWERPKARQNHYTVDPDGEKGQCRRNPPAALASPIGTLCLYPVTFAHMWCGEHAPKEGS